MELGFEKRLRENPDFFKYFTCIFYRKNPVLGTGKTR